MSMYFTHNHLSNLTDNIFESVFLHIDSPIGTNDNKTHINIILKKKAIGFFYVKDNKDDPISVHRHEHLFTLPLDSPERTGNFFLCARDYDGDIKPLSPEYRLYYASILPDKKTFEVDYFPRLSTVHELLLCLFDELNNPESDINKFCPEVAQQVRLNLEKSDVYNLIRKKFNFYKSLFDFLESRMLKSKTGDVKALYYEYLTIILNDSLAKKIPVQKLASGNWFQNPQQELEHLVRINAAYSIDLETEKNMQNYFLQKHAVVSALKMTSGKLFVPIIAFQIVAFLSFFIVWTCWLFNIYNHTDLILSIGVVSFISSVLFILVKQKNINLIMPRALVAIALVLYAIVGSEVILKNQLLVDRTMVIIAILSAVCILYVFIYSECRQHSPYYRARYLNGLFNYKITPILIYSFNAAIFLVIITQLLVTETFLNKSMVLITHTFAKQFDRLEYMRGQYTSYEEEIASTKEKCAYTFFLIAKQDISMTNHIIDFRTKDKFIEANKSGMDNLDELNQCLYLYNKLKMKLSIPDSLLRKDIEFRELNILLFPWQPNTYTLMHINNKFDYKTTQIIIDTLLSDWIRLDSANLVCQNVVNYLKYNHKLYMENEYLESLVTYSNDTTINSNKIPNYGFYYDQDRVYVIKLFSHSGKSVLKIYPKMLMLQVIIILLIGLVGQLIISDKTVTQPL